MGIIGPDCSVTGMESWLAAGLRACQNPLVPVECPACHAISLRAEWNLMGVRLREAEMDLVCVACFEKRSIRIVIPEGVLDFFPLIRLPSVREVFQREATKIAEQLRRHLQHIPAVDLMSDPLWLEAGWSATTFRWHPTGDAPPIMGLVFENTAAARELFRKWVGRFGNSDELEEIRLSIIEGDIPGQRAGYSVHVCPDPENSLVRGTAEGIVMADVPVMLLGHLRRMHPETGAPDLLGPFRRQYKKHQNFLLAPVTRRDDGQLWFDLELGIEKTVIHFRDVKEITDQDIDSVVLQPPSSLGARPSPGIGGVS